MAVFRKAFCLVVFIAAILSVQCDVYRDQVTQQDTQNSLAQNNQNHATFEGGENQDDDIQDNAHVTQSVPHENKPNTVDSDSVAEHGSIITNCTNTTNDTSCEADGQGVTGYFRKMVSDNKDMLLRTFYVVISITGIIIVYFVIKMIRTRQRQSRTKRYGLLSSRDDHLEMTPLDIDDDEDDMTLFDVNQTK